MQSEMAHPLPRGMAVLGLVEGALSFAVIAVLVQAPGVTASFPAIIESLSRGGLGLAGILTLILGAVALTIGLYRPEVCFNRNRLLVAIGIAAIVAFSVLMLLGNELGQGDITARAANAGKIMAAWLMTVGFIRLLFGIAFARRAPARRVLLIGDPRHVGAFNAKLMSKRGRHFEPVVVHARDVAWDQLGQQRVWAIVLASDPEAASVSQLMDCKLRGLRIFGGATFQEHYLGRVDLDALTASQVLVGAGFSCDRLSAWTKRVCDIIFSVAMVILTLPLMLLTALAVKADSPGPVLYRQQRIGAFGKPFTVLKFRSMTIDAEAGGKPRWAQKHDPRVTRIGRFIRATRIDELPQLVNVISGEMSLVGPRPERPHFVEQLSQAIPFYRHRAYVKPGLTGWAQVNYPYGASVEDAREKLAYDLYYVKHRSILLDLRILLATIRVVLFREGAR